FLYGVCDSLQPAVGYNWGAGRKDRVKAIEKCCFTASALISLVSAVVIFLFPTQIISLFVKNVDTVFMSTAVLAMRLFSLTYITRWLSFATQSYMTAVEKPIYASVLSVSTALVFPVVLIALLWPLELTGIWLNFPITYLLAAILATVILLRFKKEWRKAA
ncbi:MAG TPA: MATE family efflux transporter, partial [Lachnoclostridium phytofermentans]|nr:MATE family efflux transporter [Lachnoclostridium phytofermentans]